MTRTGASRGARALRDAVHDALDARSEAERPVQVKIAGLPNWPAMTVPVTAPGGGNARSEPFSPDYTPNVGDLAMLSGRPGARVVTHKHGAAGAYKRVPENVVDHDGAVTIGDALVVGGGSGAAYAEMHGQHYGAHTGDHYGDCYGTHYGTTNPAVQGPQGIQGIQGPPGPPGPAGPPSERRLKQDLEGRGGTPEPMDEDSSGALVDALGAYAYRYLPNAHPDADDGRVDHVGLIVDELAADPLTAWLVTEPDAHGARTWRAFDVIGVLLAEVKALRAREAAREERVADLTARVDALAGHATEQTGDRR